VVNTADSCTGPPGEANVVTVAARPPVTGTGEPMMAPPASNITDPAGVAPSAAFTVAISVIVAPGRADGVTIMLVVVGTGTRAGTDADIAEAGTEPAVRYPAASREQAHRCRTVACRIIEPPTLGLC
jgi:hypothetical protein